MTDTIDEAIERAAGVAEPLMSLAEVAALLNVPAATVRLWRAKGRGPRAYKVGRHVRYRHQDVLRWLEQRANSPAA